LGMVKTEVDAPDIAKIVAQSTGVPLYKIDEDERSRLSELEAELRKSVIGQEQAITAVARAIRRSRLGISQSGRPIGSFLFIGSSGVGKTALSKALAKSVFGKEDYLITVDMSEYMEKHAVSRLIGAPPGYVGFEEGGQLTEKVRRKPYSVILFDEIEKAHADVFNLLLSILDEGEIVDATGRKINFKNTVVIMTSNLCADILNKNFSLGFTRSTGQLEAEIHSKLKKQFKPEFLNRIDEIIIFNRLEKEQIQTIVRRRLDETLQSAGKRLGCSIEADESVYEYICALAMAENAGARPVARAIRNEIEDKISDSVLDEKIKKGEKYLLFCENKIIKLLDSEKVLL